MMRHTLGILSLFVLASPLVGEEITRLWLTHKTNDPSRIVVNWETPEPGDSTVHYGSTAECREQVRIDEAVKLHHVEIPLASGGVHYRVATGGQMSATIRLRGYPTDELRVAVVADWQGKPNLAALQKDDPHLLLAAGDLVIGLHSSKIQGDENNTQPFSQLIGGYPELFRTVPFLPALGNHDREIRPRGSQPPLEPVYDVDATAFRSFFPLPDDGWKWRFDVSAFDLRLIGLDLNHIQDQGTTWQTCHPFGPDSEQFRWYDELSQRTDRRFVVTLLNEKIGQMRTQAGGRWGQMLQRGTTAITGFGYFAERAEVGGFPYFNTALGKGAAYRDPAARFFQVEPSYILLTLRKGKPTMTAEIKNLAGEMLDKTECQARGPAPFTPKTYTFKQVGDLPVLADVYAYDDDKSRPVVVWIHGGALINGHRESVPKWLVDVCRESGWVLVSIDYRLAPETQLPGVMQDVEDAFAWIREKGPRLFHADPERIAVAGGSAGGYLTLATGYRVKPRPQALVSLWGYGDLVSEWYSTPSPHPRHHTTKLSREEAFKQVSGPPVSDSRKRKGDGGGFYQFCRQQGLWPLAVSGWDPHKEPDKFFPFMPVKNVTAEYPPTLLIHGDKDTDVPYEQSVLMAAEFKKHGVEHNFITLTGGEHGLGGADPQKITEAYQAAIDFLRKHLEAKPAK